MRSDKRQKMLGDDHKKASRIGDSVNDNESIMNKVSTEAEENASSIREIQQGGWVDFD